MLQILPGYTCRSTVIFESLKNGSLDINSLALNIIVSATETSCKMASTLCQNLFSKPLLVFFFFFFFCQKAQHLVQFGPNDLVQIPLACGTKIFIGMYGETLDIRVQFQH